MTSRVGENAAADLGALLSLEGKVALVTGGSGGIGSAIVRRLREAGAVVVNADLAAGEDGGEFVACDLSDVSAIESLVEEIGGTHGRLDVIVHAAGITRDAVLWKMTDAAWSDVMRINLDSAFHLLRAATPRLRERGGTVVLISSINGERGKFGQANYAASKGGLIALAKTAARELGAFGIRVNVIAPGLIETPMTRDLPDDVVRRAREEIALGRLGRPDDVASAVLFLGSDLSAHVTGQVLRVDGGQWMA